MYFVGFVLFTAFLIFTAVGSGNVMFFLDLPSLLIVLAFSLPMLMASGLFSDFMRAFKIMGKRINTWSMIELNRTEVALGLAIKLLLLSGLLGSIVGLVSISSTINDLTSIGPKLIISFLTILYAILISLVLLPLQAKVKSMILTMDEK